MAAFRPYAGLEVVDFSQGVAGPWCAMLFAQHGARVVKVEPPGGDWSRPMGRRRHPMSPIFAAFNRGKLGMTLDMRAAGGREVAGRLIARADVVVSNALPGTEEALGLAPAQVAEIRPDVIYITVSGWGRTGDLAGAPAVDTILQGVSGMAAGNRGTDGLPHKARFTPVDIAAGHHGFAAAQAALWERARGGPGRHIDIPLIATVATLLGGRIMEHHVEDGDPPDDLYSPLGIYRAADGLLCLATLRDGHFTALAAALGCPELADDPRFRGADDRMARRPELDALIESRLAEKSVEHWCRELPARGVMAAAVQDYGGFLEDARLHAAGGLVWLDQPDLGRVPVMPVPGADPSSAALPSPRLGEHTDAVLDALGYDADSRRRLREEGIASVAG